MKKKVLFLISRFLDGGIDTILVEYLRNLDFSQVEPTLAIGIRMEGLEVHLDKIPPEVRIVYLEDSPLLTDPRKRKFEGKLPASMKLIDELVLNPVRRFRMTGRLRKLVKEADAVIDFDSTFYSMIPATEKPVIGFYHFSIEENLKRHRRHTLRQMHGMSRYSNIVLLSEDMVGEGERLFPELKGKFVRIYNGYNLPELRKRGEAEIPAGLVPGGYFLMVARLEESQKDHETLFRAYTRLPDLSSDGNGAGIPELVLIGEGKDRERLEELVENLGISEKVRFLGFRSDPLPFMKNALALVHSSKFEGFGLVLVEAMALGTPVIASDCKSGPAEILEEGKSGILFRVGDVEGLAGELHRIAEDPGLRKELREKSIRRSEVFDIRRSVDRLMRLI